LRREIAFLEREKAKVSPTKDAEAYRMWSRSLNDAKAKMKALESGMGPFGRMWAEIRGNVVSAGAVLGGMFAGNMLITGAQNMIRSSMQLSDAISDVKKTTGLSTPVVRELAREIGTIDTRTSRAELLALARDAGKLGLNAKEDVMAFVRAGNQINVALGEDLGKDAIKNIGKLVDLFKLKEKYGLEDSILKVGSALNELGMASTAGEGYMVDFLKRMGGIAPIAGITIQQTLALAATLDSLGQTSEVSSTALSKLFVKLGADAAKYADLAGVSVDRFRKVLEKNALEAFIMVLDGTKKTEGGVVALAETLGDMGIDAARAAGIFGVLGQNTDRLREQMELANAAFKTGTSVTDEYNEKNTNLAATYEKLMKQFNRLIANNTVIDWLTGLISTTKNLIDWLERNANAIAFVAKILATAAVSMVTYRLGAVALVKAKQLWVAVNGALTTSYGVLTGQIKLAELAQKGFNTVVKANPLGFVISLLSTAAMLFMSFGREVDEVTKSVAANSAGLRHLYNEARLAAKGTEERKKLIEQMKQAYPDYLSKLNAETASNMELSKAMEEVNEHLIKRVVLQKREEQLGKLRETQLDAGVNAMELELKSLDVAETIAKKYKVNLDDIVSEGAKVPDRIAALLKVVQDRQAEFVKNNPGRFDTGLNNADIALRNQQAQLNLLKGYYEAESRIVIDAEKEMDEMRQKLGMASAKKDLEQKKRTLVDVDTEIRKLEDALANPRTKAQVDTGPMEVRLDNLKRERAEMRKHLEGVNEHAEGVVRTEQWLNDRIQELTTQRQNAAPGSKERQGLVAEIAKLQKELDTLTGNGTKLVQKRTGEDLDKLLAEYKRFQTQLTIDTKDADEKALAELDQQHAEELKKVQEQQKKLLQAKKLTPTQASTDLDSLRGNQAKERADLIESQGQKRLDELKAYNDRMRTMLWDANSEFLDAELTRVDNEMDLNREKQASLLDLEDQRRVVLLRIYEQNAKTALQAEIEKWDPVIEEAKKKLAEYDEALAASGEEPAAEDLKIRQDLVNGILDLEYAKNLAIESINKDRRVNEEEAERQHGLRMRQEYIRQLQHFATLANGYNDMLQGLIQYQDAGIAMAEQRADADGVRTEQELDQIERLKKARRDAALTAIAVQGAAAIANGVASAMAAPNWVVGVAQALSTVGIVLGLMAQARQIMNEANSDKQDLNEQRARAGLQDVPLGRVGGVKDRDGFERFGDGGKLTGVLDGPSHEDGGIAMIDNRTGRQVAELEGGEAYAVLSKRFVAKNQDLLPALFKASREGTRLSPFDRMPATPNPKRIAQAMQMRAGGPVTVRGTALVNMPTAPGSEDTDYVLTKKRTAMAASGMDDMLALMHKMVDLQQRTASGVEQYPRTLTARVSQQELDRRKTELEYVKDLGRGRKTA
jgi:TP901 family phage tail tape measure protein